MSAPIPGPIESRQEIYAHITPGPSQNEKARAMLARAVADLEAAGVEFGAHDRKIIAWLGGWDLDIVPTVASLLHRALHASPTPQPGQPSGSPDPLPPADPRDGSGEVG